MANKNHHRYKIRKKMNTIKHVQKSIFEEPAKLIEDWAGLVGLENDNYYLDIDLHGCNGWVRPKHEFPDDEYYMHNIYLSTHTFYGGTYFMYTTILRECGFNIQLQNWDGETRYCI